MRRSKFEVLRSNFGPKYLIFYVVFSKPVVRFFYFTKSNTKGFGQLGRVQNLLKHILKHLMYPPKHFWTRPACPKYLNLSIVLTLNKVQFWAKTLNILRCFFKTSGKIFYFNKKQQKLFWPALACLKFIKKYFKVP